MQTEKMRKEETGGARQAARWMQSSHRASRCHSDTAGESSGGGLLEAGGWAFSQLGPEVKNNNSKTTKTKQNQQNSE